MGSPVQGRDKEVKQVQQMVSETFGEFGHMMCEERWISGIVHPGEGRLRGALGECGSSLVRGCKEKEPSSSQRCTMVLCYNRKF